MASASHSSAWLRKRSISIGRSGGYADGGFHIIAQALIVIYDFHPPSAQDIGGAHHDRVADAAAPVPRPPPGNGPCRFPAGGYSGDHAFTEIFAVFRQTDAFRLGSHDFYAGVFEGLGDVKRGLASELDDDASGFSFS